MAEASDVRNRGAKTALKATRECAYHMAEANDVKSSIARKVL